MRSIGMTVLLLATAGLGSAQKWEFGGVGGAGFLGTVGVTSPFGAATTGLQTGGVAGVFLGQGISRHVGGELRYTYLQSNLQINAGGSQATFAGQSHVVHYDVILRARSRGAKSEFFLAAGGGIRLFRGTGQEAAFQPLSQYGYFTKTQVMKPMVSIGGGVKFAISRRIALRAEVRDYITAFPTALIAPAPGAKFGTILHDFVPMVGISYVY